MSSIVQRIKQLCIAHRFNEAIALTNELEEPRHAIEAHLLCIEYEQACIRDGSYQREQDVDETT